MKKIKNSRLRNISIIVVILVTTPLYVSQYRKIYQNHSDRKDLGIEGIFFD